MPRVYLPPRFAVDVKLFRSTVRQLAEREFAGEAETSPFSNGRRRGIVLHGDGGWRILVAPGKATPYDGVTGILHVPGGTILEDASDTRVAGSRWLWPATTTQDETSELPARSNDARQSWDGEFHFRQELQLPNATVAVRGLRGPQIGALHAVLAHWTISDDPATVVMPTGTGKTETMLALLAATRPARLLVIVPTDALREQITRKFLSWGILKGCGVVGNAAHFPVVGTLLHRLKGPSEVDAFFGRCNVVVTTMAIASGSSDEVKTAMASACSHLFIDEAHHNAAPTWEAFRRYFTAERSHRVVQFTATPFRNDRKPVDGRIVYSYPLKKAQDEGYFQSIRFKHVLEFDSDKADRLIAKKAIAQLDEDLAQGFDHVLMARAASIRRAKDLQVLYETLAPLQKPIVIHSDLPQGERRQALRRLQQRDTRVVCCVDMLGEGFDMPDLKVAALHDMHQSLAVTLQFTGRFARTRSDLGPATVIANIADDRVNDSLRELYAEDSDWNKILRHLSEGATGQQIRRVQFLENFGDVPAELPLRNVQPKMSTIVYRTGAKAWQPSRARDVIDPNAIYGDIAINAKDRVLVFFTRREERVSWGDVRDIVDIVWDLFLLHWDADRRLLFVNSSDHGSLHQDLARAVAGEVELIRGEQVFRCFHGINQLLLMNLGLNDAMSRRVRFTMYVGSDIRAGIAAAQTADKQKTNFFGRGYEHGAKASIGCSYRGRIWAHAIAPDIPEWVDWCHGVGAKLLDTTISTVDVLKHALIPEELHERPRQVPLVIEWPEELLRRSEDVVRFEIGGGVVPFADVGVELVNHDESGPIRFKVFTDATSAEYEITFAGRGVDYRTIGMATADIILSGRQRPLSEWFAEHPPVVRFADNSFLVFNELFRPGVGERAPYDVGRIEAWDWSGTNIATESQGIERKEDSIQYRVVQELLRADPEYLIVFDDDAAYEAADVVALRIDGERLLIDLFHLKFCTSAPGHRLQDLYEVCGQAQRSIYWKEDAGHLLAHLKHREGRRQKAHGVSRFEKGDLKTLSTLRRRLRFLMPEMRITIVQPGVSKAEISSDQLDLLAATEVYLQSTYGIEMRVITSA